MEQETGSNERQKIGRIKDLHAKRLMDEKSINQCSASACEPPWNYTHDEAKAAGFRNGTQYSQYTGLLTTLKYCLENLEKYRDQNLISRDDAIAITHLEDCILRMDKSLKQTEKNLGIRG